MSGVNRANRANPAKVALVHDWLTGMRGGEKVLEAVASLFPKSPIYTLIHIEGSLSEELESHPIHTSSLQGLPRIGRHYRSFLPFFPTAIEEFDLSHYDVIVSSSHCVAKGVIPGPNTFHLCYCHTPMRYAWDQETAYFPKRTGVVARLRALVLAQLRRWDVATAPRVHQFVANSSFVAQRIERYYGRSSEVLHPPVDTDFFTPAEADEPRTDDDYCLVVSALAPYKRLELAVEACERLGVELRIVGSGPERDRLAQLGGASTRLLGNVDATELRELYRGASCLLQPGVEDFGISSVEALACGSPVVALGRGGILDIVQDGQHGILYTEEDSPAALAAAIDKTRKLRFNKLDLRKRAMGFSYGRFLAGLRALLKRGVVS